MVMPPQKLPIRLPSHPKPGLWLPRLTWIEKQQSGWLERLLVNARMLLYHKQIQRSKYTLVFSIVVSCSQM